MRRLFAPLKPPLPLRTWMIAGIVGLVVIPWIGTFMVVGLALLFEPGPSSPDDFPQVDPEERAAIYAKVESQPERWADPDWRRQMEADLIRLNLRVYVQSLDGTVAVEMPDPWGPNSSSPVAGTLMTGTRPTREMLVYTEGQPAGKVLWLDTNSELPSMERKGSPEERLALYREVESQAERWTDPAWRASLEPRLRSLQLQVTLRLPDEQGSYQVPPFDLTEYPKVGIGPFTTYAGPTMVTERETAMYKHGQSAGTAQWRTVLPPTNVPNRHYAQVLQIIMPPIILILILLTIWLAIHLAYRTVLGPLGVLSKASRQIGAGDLDFAVPSSPITEVNEFARAFEQMRQGLKESISQQAAMEQERRMFIAALAHDLRTPLTSVRGYLEGLRDGVARTPEKVGKYVSVALEKTESLERLIESLFAFARTEYLEQSPQRERLDLGGLLQTAAEALLPRARARQIRLQVDGPSDPCTLPGDRLMLTRVVDNLLDNAIRHTPADGSITVGWRCTPDQALVWVHDSGPGIPGDDLPHIFDPLYRGDKARSTRTGGAGLGLAIARRLVEAHGGTISVTNEGGARFTITLPR